MFFKDKIDAGSGTKPPPITATVTQDAIDRLDAILKEGAEAKARLKYQDSPKTSAGEADSAAIGIYSTPPRLEPFYHEVKDVMSSLRLTEKSAERMVRKKLLLDALHRINDYSVRELCRAMLALV